MEEGANNSGGLCVSGKKSSFSSTSLQPSESFPYCSTTRNKSRGGMAASVGSPFTFGQWKELERQAMIYKYLISSVPVPPDLLLFPLSRYFPDSSLTLAGGGGIYNGRIYSKKGDPEPGRCKRTDGKKWRCSRDVAPQHKYCDRHLHRGRPRSRKPVEVQNNTETQKKARLEKIPNLLYNPKTELSVSMPSPEGTNRDLGLMIESGMATLNGTQQQLQHLMEAAEMGLANDSSSIYNFHQDYSKQQLVNLLPYSNFFAPEIAEPSRFRDGWYTDDLDGDQRNLSLSFNLPVEMTAEHLMDHERRNMNDCDGHKIKDGSRNSSPVSWEPFARGGPLAEALQLGSFAIGESNPTSPHRSTRTLATTISSPSGVIHRTLFSNNSDSSVCNSPTLAAPPSEVTFQWFN